MARTAAPYTTYESEEGYAMLNARIAGRRVRKALGIPWAADDGRTQEHAQRIRQAAGEAYAQLINGRSLKPEPEARVQTGSTLKELLELFAVDDGRTYPASAKLTITHNLHLVVFAADEFRGFADKDATPKWRGDKCTPLERLAADIGPTEYVRERLRVVLKHTVIKEVTTMFRFFAWAKQHRHILTLPPRPEYPRKAVGVRSGPQRATPVQTTHEETLSIIAAMPEWTARGGRNRGRQTPNAIPVRDLARLAYETSLRPSTIARVSIPEHFEPGAKKLWVPPEIDKGKNKGRHVALSKIALEILNRHARRALAEGRTGLLFGAHDLRVQWKRAAAKVLPKRQAEQFSIYDFRHAAGRRMVRASGGNLLGVAHQMGHKRLTTTNQYLEPSEADGDAVVEAMDRRRS
jgi:integrase